MPTLRDIAARAGVSTCTVSRILKGGKGLERFSDACGERVRKAARELEFTPNFVAKSLRTGTTGIVAFAVNWADAAGGNAFQAAMISACESAARRLGSHLLVVGDGAGQSAARAALGLAARRLCDSIIIPGGCVNSDDVDAILASGAPVSFFGALPDGVEVGAELDDAVGIESAVRHLANLGHRRLAWVGYDDRPTCRRRERFTSACAASGLEGRQAGIPSCAVAGDEASIAHTRAQPCSPAAPTSPSALPWSATTTCSRSAPTPPSQRSTSRCRARSRLSASTTSMPRPPCPR